MSNDGLVETVDRQAEAGRMEFYERAGTESLAPLWRVLHGLVTETPRTDAVPAIFEFERIRPYLMEACDIIGTEEAERRVLVLENPGLQGQSRITRSLFAGYQIILPGEIAPAHRHVASALRFIIEGKDAYTAVAGERTNMEVGDFVITPSMTWHDHGNESDGPMIWLDGLDMHIVNLLGASFRDNYPGKTHPALRPEGSSILEAGTNLLPEGFDHPSKTSPIFNYSYRRTREALDRLSRLQDPDPCHGYKMNYINPMNGESAMPTISTSMRLIPRGFSTESYRSTAGTVFAVVEGRGTAHVGDNRFPFREKDLFVAPTWHSNRIDAEEDCVIFSYSDQIVQEKLDLFREQRGDD
jgi:gentisate 1,2-dioxygenase